MKYAIKMIMVLAVVALASCTTYQLSGTQVTREIPSYDTVGEFDISINVNEFLGTSGGANLFNVSSKAMDTVIYDSIQREIQKYTGDAAVNIEIEYKGSFFNYLLNGLTLGIYAPGTAHVSGTVVKYN